MMMYALWLLALVAMAALLDASQHHEDPSIFIKVRFPRNPKARRHQIMNPTHLVKELRLRITEGDMKQFNNSYLIVRNELMANDHSVDSYGIRNGSIVQFIDWPGTPKKPNEGIRIWNLYYEGRIDITDLKVTDTVGSLKKYIQDQYKVEIELIYLLYNGQLFYDEGASLSDYDVEMGSCIGWAVRVQE